MGSGNLYKRRRVQFHVRIPGFFGLVYKLMPVDKSLPEIHYLKMNALRMKPNYFFGYIAML